MNKIMEKKPQKRAKTTQNGYFLDGKITKKFFFHIFTHSWRKYAKSY